MAEETDVSTCRGCLKLKIRIHDGFFPGGKNKKFVDEAGKQWVGRKCPDCHKNTVKDTIKQKRHKEKNEKLPQV